MNLFAVFILPPLESVLNASGIGCDTLGMGVDLENVAEVEVVQISVGQSSGKVFFRCSSGVLRSEFIAQRVIFCKFRADSLLRGRVAPKSTIL